MTITILDGGMATTLERTFHKDLSGKNAIIGAHVFHEIGHWLNVLFLQGIFGQLPAWKIARKPSR